MNTKIGDKVWLKEEQRVAIVLDVFENGDIRTDWAGVVCRGEYGDETIIPTEIRFPKCDKLADEITNDVITTIHRRGREVKSEEPYSLQCVLELIISKLEKCV